MISTFWIFKKSLFVVEILVSKVVSFSSQIRPLEFFKKTRADRCLWRVKVQKKKTVREISEKEQVKNTYKKSY